MKNRQNLRVWVKIGQHTNRIKWRGAEISNWNDSLQTTKKEIIIELRQENVKKKRARLSLEIQLLEAELVQFFHQCIVPVYIVKCNKKKFQYERR